MITYDAPLTPDQFVGREAVLDQICQRLIHQEVLSTSIVGGPRTGKTSLLRYLCSPAANRLLPSIPAGNRQYIDALILSGSADPLDFWIAVLRQVSNESAADDTRKLATGLLQEARTRKLDVLDLEDLSDSFARSGAPLVLLIDNFDAVLRNDNFWEKSNFPHVVRSLGQRHPRGLAFVIATPRPLLDLRTPSPAASPYHNIFVTAFVGRLENSDVRAFVQRAVAPVTNGAADSIETLVQTASYSHPFLTSYVTHLCVERLRAGEQPKPEQIAASFGAPDGPLVSLIRQIRGLLAPSERQLIDHVQANPQGVSESQRMMLRSLSDYGLLPPGLRV